MIKSITVTNSANQSLKLELGFPWDSRIIVEKVDGLTPTKGVVNTNSLATSDGSVFNSARQEQRNIVFELQLLEDFEGGGIETTRQKLYKYFPVKKKIRIQVVTDNRSCYTEGYVESNEPDIFSEKEKQQISVICPHPFFTSPSLAYSLNGIENLFEFPFSNESLTEDCIIFGEIVHSEGTTFNYVGDVDSGVIITISAIGSCTNPSVYNMVTNERMTFSTERLSSIIGSGGNYMEAGDNIICSTGDGDPYVVIMRGGVEYNAIAMLPKISDWIKVRSGANAFGYSADTGENNVSVSIQTQVLYGGI